MDRKIFIKEIKPMKKILSLMLVVVLVLASLVACGKPDDNGENSDVNEEKTYTLALAVDSAIGKGNKVTNTALTLALDSDGKIVAARVDTVEATPTLDDAGALVAQDSVSTKVELGDAYSGMAAGTWADQAKAFEAWLVGKTAAEIASLEFTNELIAGCTMTSSLATFKALIAEAASSENTVSFKTSEDITLGLALSTAVKSSRSGGATVTTDVASVVIADGKVAATAIDSVEQSFAMEEGALVAGDLSASKFELGDAYAMSAGSWAKQAKAFANATVGKTVAELESFEPVSDALAAAGCTMQNTTAGYKATIIKAASYAK